MPPLADPPYAFVTLVSSDSYLPGALVVAHALRDIHPRPAEPPEVDFQTVCLVTPEVVDVATIRALRKAFDLVVGVEVIDDQSQLGVENLGLLGRRDLTTVLTKLHVFRLTQFKKVIFLDADTLPLQPISHLFNLPDKLAAAPDAGWPDCFNSGVLVLEPSEQSFEELRELARTKGSWDGGDQGLLNEWAGDDWYRISFRYNTTPTAAYTYKPAYARFHEGIKLLHFIGSQKPWQSLPIRPARPPPPPLSQSHDTTYGALVDQWYAVYDRHYRPLSNVDAFATPEGYQPGAAPDTAPFHPPHYPAAWDEPKPLEAQPQADRPFGLDELRELAMRGVGSTYAANEGEGRYESLPLDGRVDLIRPRHEEQPGQPDRDEDATPRASQYQHQEQHQQPVQTGEYPPHLQRQPARPPQDQGPSHDHGYFPPPQQHEHHQDEQHQAGPSHYGEQARPAEPTHHEQWQPPPEQHHEQAPSHEQWQQPHEEHHHHPQEQEYHAPQPQPAAPPPPPEPEPFSPPLMTWNPAYEPPPNEPPPAAASFPEWQGNVWEERPRHEQREFFHPPPPARVPRSLVDPGQYGNMMGQAPDPAKVKEIFPWESQRRVPSGRVWPRGESPPPPLPEVKPVHPGEAENIAGPKLTVQSPSPPVPGASRSFEPPAAASPPTYGLPGDMSFRNAWDADPHIQRYVSKLSRPTVGSRQNSYATMRRSPLATPGIKGNFTFRRPRERGEGADASSRDGDDEEDGFESESENGHAEEEAGEEGAGDGRPKSRSRTGSVSTTRGGEAAGHAAKSYRSQAVQTEPPPKMKSRGVQVQAQFARTNFFIQREPRKDEGVQTNPTSPVVAPRPQLEPSPMPVPDTHYLLPQQQLPATPSPYDEPKMPTAQDSVRGRLADIVTDDTPVQALVPPRPAEDSAPGYESYFPPHSSVESPREVAANPPNEHPGMEPLSPVTATSRPGPTPIPPHMRLSSNETQSSGGTISPPSSLLTSPKDGEDITSPTGRTRLSIRRWDPARDVDLFKRDSQEVLARFLRMNDWEETR